MPKPLQMAEIGDGSYLIVLLTADQVTGIAEAVAKKLLDDGLDIVLADRIRARMRQLDEEENLRELEFEHQRYAPGFEHIK